MKLAVMFSYDDEFGYAYGEKSDAGKKKGQPLIDELFGRLKEAGFEAVVWRVMMGGWALFRSNEYKISFPPNIDEFLALDFTFHDIIARASKNEVLHDTVMLTRRIIEQERADSIKTNYEYKKSAAYHKAILKALKTRSPERARQAMSEHMTWTRHILRYDTKGGKK